MNSRSSRELTKLISAVIWNRSRFAVCDLQSFRLTITSKFRVFFTRSPASDMEETLMKSELRLMVHYQIQTAPSVPNIVDIETALGHIVVYQQRDGVNIEEQRLSQLRFMLRNKQWIRLRFE